jgi:SAM-dependent methyltransferase
MKVELLEYLVCPACRKGSFSLTEVIEEDLEIKTGVLVCNACREKYRIIDFIPTFIEEAEKQKRWRTAWSYKWDKVASRVRYTGEGDHDFAIKMNYTGLFSGDLSGNLVLDVGMGSGQDSARIAKLGAVVIGVDQSTGPHHARQYNHDQEHYKRMHSVRADIFNLPFKEDIFDIVFSNGVLHHTPDTKKAFDCLPRLLKKEGKIAVWVYDKTQYWRLFELFWRPVLCRLPRPVLSFILHAINRPWYWIYRYRTFFMETINPWPGSSAARVFFDALCGGHFLYLLTDYHLHIAVKEDDHFIRYHHAFDCYSPYYAWGHDEAELFQWFSEHHIEVLGISGRRCGLTGVKK